ncbi:hypothetical protein NMY22_g1351 [Coprinellus aureogranulatus]|nr:hypothetical protein NMY22_g1351 [Coprinellus aureogranulatus]
MSTINTEAISTPRLISPAMSRVDRVNRFERTYAWTTIEQERGVPMETAPANGQVRGDMSTVPPPICAHANPDGTYAGGYHDDADSELSSNDTSTSLTDCDELDASDDDDSRSMSLGSEDSFSTESSGNHTPDSFIVESSDDDGSLSFGELSISTDDNKRSHEDISTNSSGGTPAGSLTDIEDERPRKCRRLCVRPHTIYYAPDSPRSSSASALPTHISTERVDATPIRKDFMGRAAGAYFRKDKFKPAYAMTAPYKKWKSGLTNTKDSNASPYE